MYQELVDKCKQAYKEKNMPLALHYWEEIFNITSEKLDKVDIKDQGKRFMIWKEYQEYIDQFTDDEIYGITDYSKRKAYEQQAIEDIFRDKDKILLNDITNDDLDILDDFCDMYAWCPIKNKDNTYNIVDTDLNKMVEDEDYETFKELVNRIVSRAIDYFRDEQNWEDEEESGYEYGTQLYNIAKKYGNDDEFDKSWLKHFKDLLEEMKGE